MVENEIKWLTPTKVKALLSLLFLLFVLGAYLGYNQKQALKKDSTKDDTKQEEKEEKKASNNITFKKLFSVDSKDDEYIGRHSSVYFNNGLYYFCSTYCTVYNENGLDVTTTIAGDYKIGGFAYTYNQKESIGFSLLKGENRAGILGFDGKITYFPSGNFDSVYEILPNSLLLVRKTNSNPYSEMYGLVKMDGTVLVEPSYYQYVVLDNSVIFSKSGQTIIVNLNNIDNLKNLKPFNKSYVTKYYIFYGFSHFNVDNNDYYIFDLDESSGKNSYGLVDKDSNVIMDFNLPNLSYSNYYKSLISYNYQDSVVTSIDFYDLKGNKYKTLNIDSKMEINNNVSINDRNVAMAGESVYDDSNDPIILKNKSNDNIYLISKNLETIEYDNIYFEDENYGEYGTQRYYYINGYFYITNDKKLYSLDNKLLNSFVYISYDSNKYTMCKKEENGTYSECGYMDKTGKMLLNFEYKLYDSLKNDASYLYGENAFYKDDSNIAYTRYSVEEFDKRNMLKCQINDKLTFLYKINDNAYYYDYQIYDKNCNIVLSTKYYNYSKMNNLYYIVDFDNDITPETYDDGTHTYEIYNSDFTFKVSHNLNTKEKDVLENLNKDDKVYIYSEGNVYLLVEE